MDRHYITDNDAKFYAEHGYLVLKGVYSQEEVDVLLELYERIWLQSITRGEVQFDPDKPIASLFPRIRDCHRVEEYIHRFAFKTEAVGALQELIDNEVDLISTNYYFKGPGTKGMPYHQDNYGIGVSPGTCHAIWVSLSTAHADNGGMRFASGTHRLDLFTPTKVYDPNADTFAGYVQHVEVPEGYEVVTIDASPGDAVIYHGHLIHDSLDNHTETEFRNSIISHFASTATERVTLNYNYLMNKNGERLRKRPSMVKK